MRGFRENSSLFDSGSLHIRGTPPVVARDRNIAIKKYQLGVLLPQPSDVEDVSVKEYLEIYERFRKAGEEVAREHLAAFSN